MSSQNEEKSEKAQVTWVNPTETMHYSVEIPQNYHTFASNLIPSKNGIHLMIPAVNSSHSQTQKGSTPPNPNPVVLLEK